MPPQPRRVTLQDVLAAFLGLALLIGAAIVIRKSPSGPATMMAMFVMPSALLGAVLSVAMGWKAGAKYGVISLAIFVCVAYGLLVVTNPRLWR